MCTCVGVRARTYRERPTHTKRACAKLGLLPQMCTTRLLLGISLRRGAQRHLEEEGIYSQLTHTRLDHIGHA